MRTVLVHEENIKDLARSCGEVINKWGSVGEITEKGIHDNALEIIMDFAAALGAEIRSE